MALTRDSMGPLLAGTLGVVAAGGGAIEVSFGAPPAATEMHREIVVTAERPSDAATTEQVMTALRQDPYIFDDHVTVITENGVVRLEGIVSDLGELYRIMRVARRIAGKRRVVNRIEYVPTDDDGN